MTIRDRITDAAIAAKANPASPNVAGKNAGSVFETASGFDPSTASGDSTDSVFYLTYAVYIEGVEVPCSGVAIGYGVQGIPTCAVTLPASALLRDLPQTAKVAVFFKDLVPNNDGVYEWRLLFDGEFMGFGYNVDAKGASMTLNFMHNAAHMHSMQLMTMDMTEFWLNRGNEGSAGGAVVIAPLGYNKPTKTILENLLKEENASKFKSMADIVYTLVRSTLSDVKGSPTGKYFKQKFGDTVVNNDGGYKLLRRFFGISDGAKNMDIPETSDITAEKGGYIGPGGGAIGGNDPTPPPQGKTPDNIGPDRSKVTGETAASMTGMDFSKTTGRTGNNCASFVSAAAGINPAEASVAGVANHTVANGTLFTDSSQLKAGDIVFVADSEGLSHTGIYQGIDSATGKPMWSQCRGPIVTYDVLGEGPNNYGGSFSNNFNGHVVYYGRLKAE